MRFTPFILVGFLVGCVGTPVPGPGVDPTGQDTDPVYSYDKSSSDGPPGCGTMTQVIGSGEFAVTVPVPCDPYWRDQGDPPPDDEVDQVIDPDPIEVPGLEGQATRPIEF